MKFIPINRIQNVSATVENYKYPDDNVLQRDIEKGWEGVGTSGTITLKGLYQKVM